MQASNRRRRAPAAAQFLIAFAALCFVFAAYVAMLRASIDLDWVAPQTDPNQRDTIYIGLQAGFTATSLMVGYIVGKLAGGLGFAYTVLFGVAAILLGMLTHLGSYALACDGYNDLIRHWTC